MGKPFCYGAGKIEVSQSFINRIYGVFSDGIHFAAPISTLRTNEIDLVRAVLEMLQGFSGSLFYWDNDEKRFRAKAGIYVAHLSQTSLHAVVNQFVYAATCLQLVGIMVAKVEKWTRSPPTLRAFSCSASAWLRAEYLLQIVHGAIPQVYFDSNSSVPAADVTVHILDYLYKKLDEVCLVQGGEVEEYRMLLHMFIGSLLPYIEGLDSWLFEGTLDDPFEEMFFYANRTTSIDEADFWEKSYLFRQTQCKVVDSEISAPFSTGSHGTVTNEKRESILMSSSKGKERSNMDLQACPLFIRDISKAIISAGKSLQLIRHIPIASSVMVGRGHDYDVDDGFGNSEDGFCHGQSIAGLTLSEFFCVSLSGLIGHGDHIFRYLCQDDWYKTKIVQLFGLSSNKEKIESNECELLPFACSEKIWYKYLVDTLLEKKLIDVKFAYKGGTDLAGTSEEKMTEADANRLQCLKSFCPENPVLTVCQAILSRNRDSWKALSLSRNFYLPPLNDEVLRKAIFGKDGGTFSALEGTNYTFGFQFGESEHLRSKDDSKALEMLFPFPTVLPFSQDGSRLSELLPFQKNSTLPSRVLSWIQNFEPKNNILPVVIMQECLTAYIKKQVDFIGRHILSKLMNDWRLMEELAVLRAIYLLGSGDLLQHFLTVIFSKLDKGETWDDDFELNTILQESIRNSSDSVLLSAPDSLIVSLTKNLGLNGNEQSNTGALPSTPHRSRAHIFGIDGLDLLKFTYKVSWPLELIANTDAIKKYNQVMGFLLKVKRAKFLLDKARKWMWKCKGAATNHYKHHWSVEQKLLHFVDAFHQYVMDRVYHSAWQELCEGMAAARSLDEVIEVHESYLLSIQRQCFVVPDKLWALIASRINSILGLALDFYSIQQTLSGGAVSAVKAKCEMEVDRIEKQFDECIAFLLRVLSFKLNVGNFPHLADLVTRINYNNFYMSDSGNLMTAPNSENTTTRVRKPLVGRTE
ncbi:Gamma-tubulin complex component protein [Parasponia andersonii]|uniref:Gamma-tubulin complex component n=1 Tax=Parasponia andersonii TaxID=3476 RepID=A0A2P5ANG5_PARAD|nr:Gamma-tubulin complex component protein [Parasponia andersonii]